MPVRERRIVRYYLDSVGGSNLNTGRDKDHPWQTLTPLISAARPDEVWVKRGTTLNSLNVPWGGTASKSIKFGAYGAGAKPIFKGSTTVSGTWTNVSGTEYKIDASGFTGVVAYGGNTPCWFVANARDKVTILNKGTAGSLSTNQFAFSSGFLQINVGFDPSTVGAVEYPVNGYAIQVDALGYIEFDGLEVRYTTNDGFKLINNANDITYRFCRAAYVGNDGYNNQQGITNLTLEDCTADYCGEQVTYLGDGLSTEGRVTPLTVRRCSFTGNSKNGMSISERADGTYEDLTFRANHSGDFAIYGQSGGTAGTHVGNRMTFYDGGNDKGTAIYHFLTEPAISGTSISMYHGTIVKGTDANTFPRGIRVADSAGTTVTMRNWVVSGALNIGVVRAVSAGTFDHDYFCVNGATTAYSGTSAGAHSITTAPSFVDATQHDFTPASGANIVDTGLAIVGINDGYFGSAPDMGAVERLAA